MEKNVFINLRSFLLLLAVLFITAQCTEKEKKYISDGATSLKPSKKENIVDKAADSYKLSNGYELEDN